MEALQKMKSAVLAITMAAAMAAIDTAKADTVVWYTFDGLGDVGDSVADTTTVVNKAKPGTYDATVYGMYGMSKKADSTAMPIATNGVPDSVRIFDPVSGTVGSSEDSALFFTCGASASNGAMLEIANDPELHMQSFTVEAFVRLPKKPSGGWMAIACQDSASGSAANPDCYAWYIAMHDNVNLHNLVLRFTNETYGVDYTLTDDTIDFSDLKWHHVAFSVEPNASDASHTDLKLYFDYVLKNSQTFNFPIECPMSDDRPIYVGGDMERNRLFQGDMSEFRISSGALTPDKFLRPRSADIDIDKDCVLYYDFEDFTEDWSWFGAPLGDVVNKAMPGIMDGTIVTLQDLAPEFVEDTPGSRIRQTSHAAVYRSSEKSLCNYTIDTLNDGTQNRCGYVKCQPLDTAWFSKTNFTIETFFMTTNNVHKYVPFFMRKGGWNMQMQMGLSTTGGTVGYNITTNNYTSQTEDRASSFTLGEWHHFAVVVDQTGESKQIKAYLDNVLVRSRDISGITQDHNSGMDIYNGAWFFAGGRGSRSFDGKIDSMRITLRALEPSDFLSAKKIPAGRTLAHVKFDDETLNAADPEGATMVAGINEKANDSGSLASYSDDVPGGIIRDGKDGEVVSRHNTKSLSFSGSKVSWGSSSDTYQDTYYIRNTLSGEKRTSWMVEFWMKSTASHNTWSRILTATAGGGMTSLGYALSFWGPKKLTLRGAGNDPTVDSSVNVCDGKWHHIAFTYAPNADYPESKSDVKFYIDYGAEEGGYTYSGTTKETTEPKGVGLVTHPDTLKFVLGLGSDSANTYNGLIDELRISEGALVPSQFLRAEKAPSGFMMTFK